MYSSKSFLILFAGFLFCFLLCLSGKVQNRTVFNAIQPADDIHIELGRRMDAFVRESMKRREAPPGAAICVVRDGRVVLLEGYGVKNARHQDAVNEHTAFRLASLSKSFAGCIAAMLVDEGAMSWDDRVTKHWPEFELGRHGAAKDVTIRHVLSQSTGLPRHAYTNLIEEGYTHAALLESLSELDPIGKPGSFYSYQNVAYSIIEPVVRRITGKNYETLVHEKLFGPLHMRNATTNREGLVGSGNYAVPHFPTRQGWWPVAISDTYYNVLSAGGINASASDMSRYLMLLTAGSPTMPSGVFADLFKPDVRSYIRYKYFSKWPAVQKAYYGKGWRVLDLGDDRDQVVYHGGYVNGYRNSMALIPAQRTAICVLTNSSSGFADECVYHFIEEFEQINRRAPLLAAPSRPVKMTFWPA